MSMRNIRQRKPQNSLTPFDGNMRNFLGDFWGRSPFFSDSFFNDFNTEGFLSSALDIIEGENEFRAEMDLPGFDPENISVDIEDHALIISGEREESKTEENEKFIHNQRSSGAVYQKIQFPPSADLEKAECNSKNGVLTIRIPKKKESKKKSLTVKHTK